MDRIDEGEEWRPIPGAEGFYSVSNCGRVRSEPLDRRTAGRQRGRILSPACDSKGYQMFRICLPGQPSRKWKVHRAVALAFLGVPEPQQQVNHRNGIKTDNTVENLEYVSCQENIQHCWRTGLHGTKHCTGENSANARLTEGDVRVIRQVYPDQLLARLAKRFGISKQAVWHVVQRKTWTHI